MLTTTSTSRRPAPQGKDVHRRSPRPAPARRSRASLRPARPGRPRRSRVASSAATVERAVAPTRPTTALPTDSTPASRRAASIPRTSVLCACQAPAPASRTRVLIAPVARAVADTRRGNVEGGLLQRHGQRQPAPAAVQPADVGDELGSRRRRRGPYVQRSQPQRVVRRRCSTGDSECAIGTPAPRPGREQPGSPAVAQGTCPCWPAPRLELRRRCWSCSAWVVANFVSPVAGLTATKYSQGPSVGLMAAAMASAPGLPIGPGGRPAWT